MNRFLPVVAALLFVRITALAQTEEPIHYAITAPAGVSLTLDGTLTLPADAKRPVPVVLLIAGSGPTDRNCNSAYGMKSNAFKMLSDSLVSRGIAVARYDKRGSGTNLMVAAAVLKPQQHQFDFYVSDAVGFIRQLQADRRFSRVIVAGHSEGSLVGMLAARQTSASAYVSLAGAGRNIADVLKEQGRRGNPAALQAEVDVALDSMRAGHGVHPKNPALRAQLPAVVQPGFISWMKYDPAVEIRSFRGPVLIVQGKTDIQVSVNDAELLKAARPDAKLVLFDTMNHVLKTYTGTDLAENMKTYSDSTLSLAPGLATALVQFVKSSGAK